jgi:tRNA/tmRNA/rRNA uracil-C5-methylase (TrmA/RlmC/RlmD family)
MGTESDLRSCPHRPPCPGCPRFGERGIAAGAQALLDQLARTHGLPAVIAVSGPVAGFRLRARLAVRGRMNSPKVGLFESGSHRVVHIPACSVQHPLINRVAAVVRRALVDARVSSYSDKAHLGIARYLQVVVERSSQTAQVVVVGNTATAEPLAACLELIRARLGAELHSLWFNSQRERSNTILGPDFEHLAGPASVVERFGGAAVHYPPGAFGQSNPDVAQTLIEHVREAIPVGAAVTEFYAGVGAIGLSVAHRVGALCMNEVSPHSLQGLDMGLAGLDAIVRARTRVVPGPAGTVPEAAAGAQVVIADPPRRGLDPELTRYLSEHPPERFLYVSCSVDSLLADTARLTLPGKLRLAGIAAFNLLPFTGHVETVARFEAA